MASKVSNKIVVEEGIHSKCGASSAERWLGCPGSNNIIARLIAEGNLKPSQSQLAAEGTAAHLVLSTCLEDGSDAHEMKDMEIEVGYWTFPVDEEMVGYIQSVLDWVRERITRAEKAGFTVKMYVERGLSSIFDEDAFGTADVIIHISGDPECPNRFIVVDLKYGKGVVVEPDSLQNKYYGYLSLENYRTDLDGKCMVESWIAQPRIPHPGGIFRRLVTDDKELNEWWTDTVLPGIDSTRDPDALLITGKHCRWCPARNQCPALKKESFDFTVDIKPEHLTNEELGALLEKGKILEKYIMGLSSEALHRARAGEQVAGYKLVKMKSNRTFKDNMAIDIEGKLVDTSLDAAAMNEFGLDAYSEPKLKSPAQMAKLSGGKDFVSLWAYTPDKGVTLAPNSDKRLEIRPTIERFRGKATRV